MAIKRFRKTTQAERLAECDRMAARFPGRNMDTLARNATLGNSFRSIDSLDFKVVKTGTMKAK